MFCCKTTCGHWNELAVPLPAEDFSRTYILLMHPNELLEVFLELISREEFHIGMKDLLSHHWSDLFMQHSEHLDDKSFELLSELSNRLGLIEEHYIPKLVFKAKLSEGLYRQDFPSYKQPLSCAYASDLNLSVCCTKRAFFLALEESKAFSFNSVSWSVSSIFNLHERVWRIRHIIIAEKSVPFSGFQ